MQPTILVTFVEFSRTAFSMSAAGVALVGIGLFATRNEIAKARGVDKIVALSNVCFAVPLAVFGAEHLSGAKFLANMVPSYVPWHLFWAYFVGIALIAASLSIATKIQMRWSGLLFGIMMFLFVVMIHLPGALADHSRFSWTVVFREPSFAAGAWLLSASAMDGSHARARNALIAAGRVIIGIAMLFFAAEQLLHPLGMPGIPLAKEMPSWIPLRPLIGYLTGAFLLAAGGCFLLAKKTRAAAAYLGAWILLLVLVIYGPVMIVALSNPSTAVKVEGLNYFADTLLFSGAILALANALREPTYGLV
jgi:uncharacterized membrane protein